MLRISSRVFPYSRRFLSTVSSGSASTKIGTAAPSNTTTTTASASSKLPLSYAEESQQQSRPSNAADTNQPVFAQESEYNYASAVDPTATGNGNNTLSNGGDWATSFNGIGQQAFSKDAIALLLAPLADDDIEVKPDGMLYLPEIKYRRVLNKAFGPGAWGLAPRGPHTVLGRTLTREYALIVHGRFVSQARGEQDFFSQEGLPTATEGVKSNALMRCCKDLGVASELWDPVFIRKWKTKNAQEVWALDVRTKGKKRLWKRKGEKLAYPYQEA